MVSMMEYAAALRPRRLGAGAKRVRRRASLDILVGAQPRPQPAPEAGGGSPPRERRVGGWRLLAADGSLVAVAVSGIIGEFEIGHPMRRFEDNRRALQDELAARYAAVVRRLQIAAASRPPSPLHDKFALSCRPRRCERRSP